MVILVNQALSNYKRLGLLTVKIRISACRIGKPGYSRTRFVSQTYTQKIQCMVEELFERMTARCSQCYNSRSITMPSARKNEIALNSLLPANQFATSELQPFWKLRINTAAKFCDYLELPSRHIHLSTHFSARCAQNSIT